MAKKKSTTRKKTTKQTAASATGGPKSGGSSRAGGTSSSRSRKNAGSATAASPASQSGGSKKRTSTKKKQTRTTRSAGAGGAAKKGPASSTPPAPVPGAQATPVAAPRPDLEHLNGQELSDQQLRKVTTGLTRKELDAFRKLLLEKRAELIGDVESLEKDARNEDASISYEHMADVGTDSYEQEFTLGLVESERKLLREIDEALERISKGTYGVCVVSGEPIGKARLEAKPWAKHSIEVARERERRGLG